MEQWLLLVIWLCILTLVGIEIILTREITGRR